MVPKPAILLLVVAAAATAAVLAVPRLDCTRDFTNDLAACATLRCLVSAEDVFRAARRIDVDRDGAGEFGFAGELSGGRALPRGAGVVDWPVLSGAFRDVAAGGCVSRSGYRFRVFLPDARGDGVHEAGPAPGPSHPAPLARAAATDAVDPKLASRTWCAYAWPERYGETGTWTFFVDQEGDVLRVDAPGYSGDHGPDAGAAFVAGGRFRITGETKSGARAQDGLVWTAVP